MAIRLLHTADLHLGARYASLGEYGQTRRKEAEATLGRIVALALEESVAAVLVAGDLFDAHRGDEAAIAAVKREFGRLAEGGITAVVVPGTHDSLAYVESVFRREDFPFHVFQAPRFTAHELLVGDERLVVHGLAYDPQIVASWEDLRPVVGARNVILVHAVSLDNPQWDEGLRDFSFRPEELGELAVDYVALGHYHNWRTIEAGGRTVACYPGSPEGRNFTDLENRYVALVTLTGGGAQVERRAVQTRRLRVLEVEVTDLADDDEVAARVREQLEGDELARVRLIGHPEFVPDLSYLHALLEGTCLYLEFRDESDLVDSRLAVALAKEKTLEGAFVRSVRSQLEGTDDPAKRQELREALKVVLAEFRKRAEAERVD